MSVPAHLGYVALGVLVGGESLGLLVPGETALIAAGILAHIGRLDLGLALAVGVAAAIAGDNIGYLLGRRGVRLVMLSARGPFRGWRRHTLERGQRFFARHGPRAVFIGRWVAVARVTVPWLAGGSDMPWRVFLMWNVLGGATWVVSVLLAGYVFGAGAAVAFASVNTVLLLALIGFGGVAAWRAR